MVKYIRIYIRTKNTLYILFTQCLQILVYFISILHILHNGARLIDNTSVQIYMCVQKYLLAQKRREEKK